jgi:hypothetical protein
MTVKKSQIHRASFLAIRLDKDHRMPQGERPPIFRRLHFHFRQRTTSHRLFSAPPSFFGSFSLPLLQEDEAEDKVQP